MRVQHNIMAMNAYRNYSSNTSALSKNLEKLSSGYKINRAGDDAAGLAISEKMRAQISGLDQAQSNAKSGINLVQTAEGSLTEVHSMLNRMVTLSDQSANGTYDNETDRGNLQKEVSQLKSEIDRIADSSNFNGIKLLDGSLSAAGASGASAASGAVSLSTEMDGKELAIKDVAATKGSYASTAFSGSELIKNGETMELTATLSNGKNVTASLTAKNYTDGTTGGELVGSDGTVFGKYTTADPATADLGKAMTAALKGSDLAQSFKVADNGDGSFTLTNIQAGADAPQVMKNFNVTIKNADGTVKGEATNAVTSTKGEDAYQTIDASQLKVYDGTSKTELSIDGKKFAVLVSGSTGYDANLKKATDAGLQVVTVSNSLADTTTKDTNLHLNGADGVDPTTDADLTARAKAQGATIATALGKALGYNVTYNEAIDSSTKLPAVSGKTNDVNANFAFKKDTTIDPTKQAGTGLTLQIGDTAESFNKLTVSVGDMHSKALGIGDIDISTQGGATAAMEKIKSAINSVSSTRGNLGALQNRLDHTINNLGVMNENIQDAESTVRDTDVAKEMMDYTKNNILVQSAQAMLAQANQAPQGVLQLLQ